EPRVSGLKDRAALGINHQLSLKLCRSVRKFRLNKLNSVALTGLYIILFIYSRGCTDFQSVYPGLCSVALTGLFIFKFCNSLAKRFGKKGWSLRRGKRTFPKKGFFPTSSNNLYWEQS
ncbi:MAG: hypothetical protein IJW23_06595, partial [Lentisphaeria bacterium]|nr:hypothetical protein [Lentisphaeria bacterium]